MITPETHKHIQHFAYNFMWLISLTSISNLNRQKNPWPWRENPNISLAFAHQIKPFSLLHVFYAPALEQSRVPVQPPITSSLENTSPDLNHHLGKTTEESPILSPGGSITLFSITQLPKHGGRDRNSERLYFQRKSMRPKRRRFVAEAALESEKGIVGGGGPRAEDSRCCCSSASLHL